MDWRTFTLELLKAVVSWPLAVLVLGVAFGRTFRKEIAQFLSNIGFIRFPGGTEIRANQLPPAETESSSSTSSTPEPDPSVIALNPEQQAIIRGHIEELTKKARDAAQEKEQIIEAAGELLSEKEKEVRYWWFQYLSLFPVPATKLVLRWFASQSTLPTKSTIQSFGKT